MVRKRFLLVDERTDSIDSLTRVLRLSGYVMLTGPAAAEQLRADATTTECWRMPTREQRGRELLNSVALLSRRLSSTGSTGHQRRQWRRQIKASRLGLEALYARGLDRDFLSSPAA